MPEKTAKPAVVRAKAVHPVVRDLKQFISACAQLREQAQPEKVVANVGRAVGEFIGEMDEGSKKLIGEVVGMFRGRR